MSSKNNKLLLGKNLRNCEKLLITSYCFIVERKASSSKTRLLKKFFLLRNSGFWFIERSCFPGGVLFIFFADRNYVSEEITLIHSNIEMRGGRTNIKNNWVFARFLKDNKAIKGFFLFKFTTSKFLRAF